MPDGINTAGVRPENKRRAAVAGQFYPAGREELSQELNGYLDRAGSVTAGSPAAIIVPHAGYAYSAPVAASAFKALIGKKIDRVILLGNSHHQYFSGVAADNHDSWQTPLGKVAVDSDFIAAMARKNRLIKIDGTAHEGDHVLEVELPFLQTVIKNQFKIVPLLFGNAGENDYQSVAKTVAEELSETDLLLVSSDLSHYPAAPDAKKTDGQTLALVAAGEIEKLKAHRTQAEEKIKNEQTVACGLDGILTVMSIAKEFGWQAQILKYQNSGDAPSGDKSRVVGYGAVLFSANTPSAATLNQAQRDVLLELAKNAAEKFVLTGRLPDFNNDDERLNWPEGAFVTIKKAGVLRGCIGRIFSEAPLWQTVREMAVAAASEDSRFSPIKPGELPLLTYGVSVLSKAQKIDDWRKIKLGQHGVIVKKGYKSGVFLPQVAEETGWTLETFLDELCTQKAGLPAGCYKNDLETELSVFTAQVF